jgi:TRAP-type C4-dicarboxylate transport system permease small subunit
MKGFVALFSRFANWMYGMAGIVLFLMMLLTVADVILRTFGTAIVGTYELVSVAGAIVIGFSLPQTTAKSGHVNVDFLIEGRSDSVRNAFFVITRILGILLFALLCYYLYRKGVYLRNSGQVSLTLHVPQYPVAFSLSFCTLIQCFILVNDIFKVLGGGDKR